MIPESINLNGLITRRKLLVSFDRIIKKITEVLSLPTILLSVSNKLKSVIMKKDSLTVTDINMLKFAHNVIWDDLYSEISFGCAFSNLTSLVEAFVLQPTINLSCPSDQAEKYFSGIKNAPLLKPFAEENLINIVEVDPKVIQIPGVSDRAILATIAGNFFHSSMGDDDYFYDHPFDMEVDTGIIKFGLFDLLSKSELDANYYSSTSGVNYLIRKHANNLLQAYAFLAYDQYNPKTFNHNIYQLTEVIKSEYRKSLGKDEVDKEELAVSFYKIQEVLADTDVTSQLSNDIILRGYAKLEKTIQKEISELQLRGRKVDLYVPPIMALILAKKPKTLDEVAGYAYELRKEFSAYRDRLIKIQNIIRDDELPLGESISALKKEKEAFNLMFDSSESISLHEVSEWKDSTDILKGLIDQLDLEDGATISKVLLGTPLKKLSKRLKKRNILFFSKIKEKFYDLKNYNKLFVDTFNFEPSEINWKESKYSLPDSLDSLYGVDSIFSGFDKFLKDKE